MKEKDYCTAQVDVNDSSVRVAPASAPDLDNGGRRTTDDARVNDHDETKTEQEQESKEEEQE